MSEVDELRAEAAELYRLLLDTTAERDALSARLQAVEREARSVMESLAEYGPSIVAHLLDTDNNAGQRLRDLLDASLGTPGDEKPQPSEPESMVWTVDLGGGMVSPDGDDAAAHQRMVDSWVAAAAEKIVDWVNANGGEARYEADVPRCGERISGLYGAETICQRERGHRPMGHRPSDGIWEPRSRIAVRTVYGWQYAKPGDRITPTDKWFRVPRESRVPYEASVREFTVSPSGPSGRPE